MKHLAMRFILICLLVSSLLAACSKASESTPTLSPASPSPTATAEPTVTPTPLPPLLVLIAPQGEETPWFNEAKTILEAVAQQEGIAFEIKPSLTTDELQHRPIPLVVILPGEVDPVALANAAPLTQFLAIGSEILVPQDNLSLISATVYRPDWEGFVAGFIAALVTEDWRVAVVADSLTVEGKAAQNGYRNGVRYLCGLCQPLYPPFPVPTYPLYGQLSPASSAADVEAVIAYFQTWSVKTVYLHQPAPEWLTAFGQAGFNLISDQPPPAGLRERWIASVQGIDLSTELQLVIPLLLEGKGGQNISLSLTLTNVNEALFSPGRQAYAEQMIGDLLSGLIDSGVDPISGEFLP